MRDLEEGHSVGRKYAPLQRLVLFFCALVALVAAASPRLSADGLTGGLKGSTTSQQGTVRLPGVSVTVLDARGREAASSQSDAKATVRKANVTGK